MLRTKRQFNNEEKEQILNLYQNTDTNLEKLCRKFHCSRSTIREIIVQNGINFKRGGRLISKETLDRVVELYNEGNSLSKISRIVGHSKDMLSKHLKNLGISIINRQNTAKFNENVFDIIDTEEKAYWLGFIFADGYIGSPLSKGKNKGKNVFSFAISLNIKDYNHLLKFNHFMEHNKINIRVDLKDSVRPHCTWKVRNKHIWEVLNSYGCTPKKSLTLKFPDLKIFKNPNLIRHFIRGFFDGDGCLSYNKSGYNGYIYPRCGFTGTKDVLENIDFHLGKQSKHYHCTFGNEEWNGITWSNWYTCKDTVDIIRFLYDNANIYLDRKYKRYKFFKYGSRSLQEWNELLASEIGEVCDDDPEVITEIAKGSVTP